MVNLRLMLITRNVDFSIKMVRALESIGGFTVRPFTSANNAIEYLRQHPQDVALVDFETSDLRGDEAIRRMRAIQPDLGVIVAPDHAQVLKMTADISVQGVITLPVTARKLKPVVEAAAAQIQQQVPDTDTMPPTSAEDDYDDDADTQTDAAPVEDKGASIIEYLLSDSPAGTVIEATRPLDAPQMPLKEDESTQVFDQLADEEPPLPDFEASATVSDLMGQMRQERNLPDMIDAFINANFDDKPQPSMPEIPTGAIPAALIMENATDQSTPMEGFSISQFLRRINEQMPERGDDILPLPSWVKESVRYTREPDFLPDKLPMSELLNDPLEYTATPTAPTGGDITQADPGNILTEQMEPVTRSHPPHEQPAPKETQPAPEKPPPPPDLPEMPAQPVGATPTPMLEPVLLDTDSPEIAQIAVTLTQASLELTAQATIIARENDIVAYAGELMLEDIDELREQIGDDWQAEPNQARIRFVRLESSGADYMMYSRLSQTGYTISMLFGGTLPLGSIRRQGNRLMEALSAAPEPETVVQATQSFAALTQTTPAQPASSAPQTTPKPAPAEVVAELPPEEKGQAPLDVEEDDDDLSPFTYVWVMRDLGQEITDDAAQSLIMGLDTHLTRMGWQVRRINIGENYVYLYADLPEKQARRGRSLIHDVMNLSADLIIAEYPGQDASHLWSDSYLALSPGRDLTQEDIQRFINFVAQ